MFDRWFDEDPEESCEAPAHRPRLVAPVPEDAYDRAISRAAACVATLLAGREAAPALWAELARHPQPHRLLLLANRRRFQTWGLFDLLLARSRQSAAADPRGAADSAELAVALAGHLRHALTPGQVADCRAAARGALADAYRMLGRYGATESCLAEAFVQLSGGTDDLHERARLLLSRAAWLEETGCYTRSVRAYGQAAELFEDLRLTGRATEMRLRQTGVLGQLAPERALATLRLVLPRLDLRLPRLELVAHHQMAWFANDAGLVRQALRVFDQAQDVYARFTDVTARMRRLWLKGRIARTCGALEEAERDLLCAWYVLGEFEMARDLMLCSLDLLEVYRLSGKDFHAVRLSKALLRDLDAWGFGDEAKETWLAAMRTSDRRRFARLALYVRRSWHRLSDGVGDSGPDES